MNDDDLDDITFSLGEAEDTKPFYDLQLLVDQYDPEHLPAIDALIRGETVKCKDITASYKILVEEVMPYYERDGIITEPNMAHIHETMVRVGRQL